jgi:phosphotransferase system enzyme I (PtsI)
MGVRTASTATMEFSGVPVAPGIALAKAFIFKHLDLDTLKDHHFPVESVANEIARLEHAINESAEQVGRLQAETRKHTGDQVAEIFEAHGALLRDQSLLSRIRSLVSEKGMNAEFVLANEIAEIESRFASITEEHLQARLLDIQDVLHRLLRNLLNIEHVRTNPLRRVTSSVILVAENLLPSDLTLVDFKHISGIALAEGSAASHVAIMSRSMRVPAVFRASGVETLVRNDMPLIIDGFDGRIIVNPSAETRVLYEKKSADVRMKPRQGQRNASCKTSDGMPVSIMANAASLEEVEQAIGAGAEGIGLFRSEFYYMSLGRLPSVQEETEYYRQVIARSGALPFTLRLLDLGADKSLPNLRWPAEQNPQLGMRGIRVLLENPEILRNHLTAIIRASAFSPLRLLIPFVSHIEEVGTIQSLIREIAYREGADAARISVGMMVEIPAVLFSLHTFLSAVDFLSVGTNDLMQYVFAVDREQGGLERFRRNTESLACRIAGYIASQASAAKKPATICGELAGDPRYASILVGMGVTSLSMQADAIGAVSETIGGKSRKELEDDARRFVLSPLDGALFASHP